MSANGKTDRLTPKQELFIKLYNSHTSPTFGNARQSALKAGYSAEYADKITTVEPEWLSDNVRRRKKMLRKAEERLDELVVCDDLRVSAQVSQFIAKTLGKNEGYSERHELSGVNGAPLIASTVPDDEFDRLVDDYVQRKAVKVISIE